MQIADCNYAQLFYLKYLGSRHKFLKHNKPTLASATKHFYLSLENTRVFWTIVLEKVFKRNMQQFAVRVKNLIQRQSQHKFLYTYSFSSFVYYFLFCIFKLCQIEITYFKFGKLRNCRCKNLDFPIT